MRSNFFMSLRTQYENLGDYMIAQATIDVLKDLGDITLDVRDVPEKYLNLFDLPENVTLTKKGFISNIISSKSKNWVYIMKPGGYLISKTFKQKAKVLLVALYILFTKIFLNAKIYKMPHSYGADLPIADKISKNVFDLILARDKYTYNIYERSNIKKNLYLVPDMSILYTEIESKFKSKKDLKNDNIIISLRFDRLDCEADISYEYAKKLKEKENIKDIIYLTQVTFDEDINEEYARKNNTTHVKYDVTNNSISEICDTFSSAKYVISNRLHVLLLGLINGAIPIPLVDLDKDKKIYNAFEYLNIKYCDKKDILTFEQDEIKEVPKLSSSNLVSLITGK